MSGIAFVAISVALAASTTPASRGVVMGGYSTSLYLGLALGSFALGPVITHQGYAAGFAVGGALAAIGTLAAALLWATGGTPRGEFMKVKEIEAKTVLVRSKLPDADYVVNPYTGCELGCQYCYASFTGRFVSEPINNWGRYVYAKVNAVSVFKAELGRVRRAGRAPSILLSSVTDAYQGIERKYRLTRGILEELTQEPYPGVVSILTKSPMVLRDVDLLRRIPRADAGLTITTTNDRLSRFLEVRAPLASRRLRTLAELHAEGIQTYAFVGPLLPHFRHDPEALDALFAGLAQAGVGSVFVEHINLRPYIKQRLWQILNSEPPAIQKVYRDASTAEHRHALDAMIAELLEKHGLKLRLNRVLYHNQK